MMSMAEVMESIIGGHVLSGRKLNNSNAGSVQITRKLLCRLAGVRVSRLSDIMSLKTEFCQVVSKTAIRVRVFEYLDSRME